jgi:PD-(D/E)XK nuclease superfamily
MSSQSYIEKNRDFVTASKLKTFIKSPEAYYLQYIKEVPSPRETSKAFTLGTAFDDALSYGAIEWNKKYFVDD